MDGPKIVENIFFTVTCISVFTCVIRSDYNFAMGLLSYYMIKNVHTKVGSEVAKVARTVSAPPFSLCLRPLAYVPRCPDRASRRSKRTALELS